MLQFFIGLFLGGVIGFGVCAICAAANTDNRGDTSHKKEDSKFDVQD